MTFSETCASALLEKIGARVSRIPTEQQQTPDFRVSSGGVSILVEIKEIAMNSDELKWRAQVENERLVVCDGSRARLRFADAIREANRQLKAQCQGRPCIVILQDVRDSWMRAFAPQQDLLWAMFGEETFWVTVPSFGQPSRTVAHSFGRRERSTTADKNTTTSAVGLLLENGKSEYSLWLHHNPFAATPLPRGAFRSPLVREFVISSTNQFTSFSEVCDDGA